MKLFLIFFLCYSFLVSKELPQRSSDEFRTFYYDDYESRVEARFIQYSPDSLFVHLEKRNQSVFKEKLTKFSFEDRIYVTKRHNQWLIEMKKPEKVFSSTPNTWRPQYKIINRDPYEESYLGNAFKNHWRDPSRKFKGDYWAIINHINVKRNKGKTPVEFRPDPLTGERNIFNFENGDKLCPPSGCR